MPATFPLQIVTPHGVKYEQDAQILIVNTTEGQMGIMKGHIDCVAPIETGVLRVKQNDGSQQVAAVSGGFVSVAAGKTRVVAITCEWAQEIDLSRAEQAAEIARQRIAQNNSKQEVFVAKKKLKRSLNRIHIANTYR